MQIRHRNTRIELIRITYDPTIRRSRSRLLGAVSADALEPSDELLEKLTDGERAQLDSHLRPLRHSAEWARQREAAAQLPALIAQATAWYAGGPRRDAALSSLAASTRDAFSALLAAQVKAGVGRRRRRRAHERS